MAPKSRPNSRHAFTIALFAVALIAAPASAEKTWSVARGQVIVHFNQPFLSDLGFDLAVTATPMSADDGIKIETPRWAFPIRAGSDFQFKTESSAALRDGSIGGAIHLDGSVSLRDRQSNKLSRFSDLEIVQVPNRGYAAQPGDGRPIVLRSASTGMVFCELVNSMFDFRPGEQVLRVHYLNLRITDQWAQAIGRPELAGLVIGGAEIRGAAKLLSSTPSAPLPDQANSTGGTVDVKMGVLSAIQQVGHVGTHPTGTIAMAMATTICNVGTVDVPWLEPMQENHPVIHMALYRLLNNRFEQIGISWMKHGFFALSDEDCSACQHPSPDGTWLGVGCSDTYGVDNNQDRNFLGPRSEVNPYTAHWTCKGSHFANGVQDCQFRHFNAAHDPIQHRLISAEGDLGNAGAQYFYEACYFVQGDQNLHNNWASRQCAMTWTGSFWQFNTSFPALTLGPTLERWGELRTYADMAPDDGQVLLAVQTTDLGGGMWHYEYALFNRNSDRAIRSFSLPVAGVANITNIGFHDNNSNAGDDWPVTLDAGTIRWSIPAYETNINGNGLTFGSMFNFRFDAQAAPSNVMGVVGPWKSPFIEVAAATKGPLNSTVGVGKESGAGEPRITNIRPNPARRSATIAFELPRPSRVKLEIFDAAGRVVRTLVDASNVVGPQSAAWDGKSSAGVQAAAGVYHVRLQAGTTTVVRPLVMVK